MKFYDFADRNQNDCEEEVIIVSDASPTMKQTDFTPSRKDGADQASAKLIQMKAELHPDDQVGIIAFNTKAHVLHDLGRLKFFSGSLMQSLDKTIPYGCGTNFTAALKKAEQILLNTNSASATKGISGFLTDLFCEPVRSNANAKKNDGVTRRIIMLTDGLHNGWGSPLPTAQRLKDAGVIIECIGIAGKPSVVDERLLKQIASVDSKGQPRYCFIGDTQSLIRKYESLAYHIRAI